MPIQTPADILVEDLNDSLKSVMDHKDEGCNDENHRRIAYHQRNLTNMIIPTFQNTTIILEKVNAIAVAMKVVTPEGGVKEQSRIEYYRGRITAYGMPTIIAVLLTFMAYQVVRNHFVAAKVEGVAASTAVTVVAKDAKFMKDLQKYIEETTK